MSENIRSYIILNGKSSRQVQGLLITELPPIRKPQQRTQAETVDGRDGDIITELGFAAYDKTLEIALTYNYDIDDIIEFFNSSGRVIFSNEPEKYYRYAIYKEIDFERLLRFKKAKVVFHVQPFKFSDSETVKTYNYLEQNGDIIIRNNGNIYSRPTITITGSGEIALTINGSLILSMELNTNQTIVIDAENMNATSADGLTLLNRKVSGDYDKIRLKSGRNTITLTGSVSEISIDKYSRWI